MKSTNVPLLLLICLLLIGYCSPSKSLEGSPKKVGTSRPSPCITFHFSKSNPLQPRDVIRLSGTPGLDGILVTNQTSLPLLYRTLCFNSKQHPQTMATLKRGCWTYKIIIEEGSPQVTRITTKNIWRCLKREVC
jgi:hypothetical protein